MNNNNNLPIIFGGNNPHHPLLAHFGNINVPLNSPAENQIIAMQRRQTLNDLLSQTTPNVISSVPVDNIQTDNENPITITSNIAQTVGASISIIPYFKEDIVLEVTFY
jgi:hypothetical protein